MMFKEMILSMGLMAAVTGIVNAESHEDAESGEPKSSYTRVVSSAGLIAHNFFHGEAIGKVLLEKGERIVVEIEGVQAVSFSPDGKKLLLSEAQMDDDQRSFVLDVSGEEIVVPAEGDRERLGPRYVVKWVWSPDSKFLVFFQAPDFGEAPVVVAVPE